MGSHPPVEARSLSSVTQLAGNPPKYPKNPTQEKHPPLVLYIARVPGSKDIILTTMKPGLKNLTADDVANSLYYLHRNVPEDELLIDQASGQNFASGESRKDEIPRKPVPDEQKSLPSKGIPTRRPVPQSSQAYVQQPPNLMIPATGGEPFSAKNTVKDPRNNPTLRLPAGKRPLGPRPLSSAPYAVKKGLPAIPGEENIRSTWNGQQELSKPGLETDPHQRPRTGHSDMYRTSAPEDEKRYSTSSPFDHKWTHTPPPSSTITIIRRDPPTAAQWNIGTICCRPTSAVGTLNPPVSNVLVAVEITTPGYNQFKNYQSATPSNRTSMTATESHGNSLSYQGFERQVLVEWTNFWGLNFKQHRRRSLEAQDGGLNARTGHSNGVISSMNSGYEPESKSTKSLAKNYMFFSPWNGRCDFSTGNGGKSLKCRHTLPDPASTPSSTTSYSQPSVAVSELRFNLPSAAIFSSRTPQLGSESPGHSPKLKLGHIRNKLSLPPIPTTPLRPNSTSYDALYPSDDEADDKDGDDSGDHLDLTLGRENAGGGNRGKRAKLGKLIVHDEGLKMLDLVVATNMGIWWDIWEK